MSDNAPPRLPLLAAICLAPRRTMRWMLDHPAPRQSFAVLVAALLSYSMRDIDVRAAAVAASSLGTAGALLVGLLAITAGVLVATVFFFVLAAAATAAGRMLGGSGTFGAVRTAMIWGLAPQVWAMVYRIPAVIFWPHVVGVLHGGSKPGLEVGSETVVFRPIDFGSVSFAQLAIYVCLELTALTWYLVVGSRTLAEAQGFSSWRGLANLLLAVVLPFVALILVVTAAFLAIKTS